MNTNEIRASYLKFFEDRGHKIAASSSLIPYGDPTLLLTSAGMVQFKPYYTGKEIPPSTRMATCQKCFRTTDIEAVGDATHCTFFEMLGNFSFGDYFKKDTILWAWEYVTQVLKISPAKLWITIYRDDDEAYEIWRSIGISDNRIVRLGEKDNFWGPAGNSGPCGPCSEIHYDLGVENGCGKPDCKPGCDCKRYTEIWNLVFPQFFQDETGKRTLLEHPGIDTGMGLLRVATITQGKKTLYDTDLFVPLMQRVAEIAGKKYGEDETADFAMRVVAEHGRSVAFLIADGVMPGKDGRGYVLRRLIRRAEYFAGTLAQEKPFLVKVAGEVVKTMGQVYPELNNNSKHIIQVIESEVSSFRKALPVGRGILENTITKLEAQKLKTISGADAFTLHDTYGFPIDLTKEIAAKRGFSVDTEGFETEMEKQRERAKAAHKFQNINGSSELQLDITPTKFAGYETLKIEAKILAIIADGESVGVAQEGQEAQIALDVTPFYGEMGGQVGDTGMFHSATGKFTVNNTIHAGEVILHQGKVSSGSFAVDHKVHAEVDIARRLDIARNHTATHLLQNALKQIAGNQVQQRGSLVTPERLRFDFSQMTALTPEQIQQVQRLVNERIRQNLPVHAEQLPYKEAVKLGAIALFEEKYGDVVRVLKVGDPVVSMELCGGTHVDATGQIGELQIVSESSIGTGLRRIEAVTGRGAEEHFEKLNGTLREIAGMVGGSAETAKDKVNATLEAMDAEKKLRQAVEKELSHIVAETLARQAETVNEVKVIAAHVPSLPPSALLEMGDILREKMKSAVIVLGTVYQDKPSFLAVVTQDLVAKGFNAGNIIREVAKVAGGGGGGKPTLAQAGGKDKTKVDEAISLVKSLVLNRGK
ncbi:MAG: alanine--tRNA ligase [Dehalococcoidales bacterium]|nr:alanine--tRNA ligase [Dehalococcoidales bacterium]